MSFLFIHPSLSVPPLIDHRALHALHLSHDNQLSKLLSLFARGEVPARVHHREFAARVLAPCDHRVILPPHGHRVNIVAGNALIADELLLASVDKQLVLSSTASDRRQRSRYNAAGRAGSAR